MEDIKEEIKEEENIEDSSLFSYDLIFSGHASMGVKNNFKRKKTL